MSRILQSLNTEIEIPYSALPGVIGNLRGALYQIRLENRHILAAEIPEWDDTPGYLRRRTIPVRIAQQLGVETALLLGCGKSLESRQGLVVVENHINLLGDNPLIGKNPDALGDRFPDMTSVYSTDFQEKLLHLITNLFNREVNTGILVAHNRPEDLTAEEQGALRQTGSCYFSTDIIPEAIAARHGKMRIGGVLSAASNQQGKINEQAAQQIKSVMLAALSEIF